MIRRSIHLATGAVLAALTLLPAQQGPDRGPAVEAHAAVARWLEQYPSLVQQQRLGASADGRDLQALRITASNTDDAPELCLVFGMHGGEHTFCDAVWLVDQLLARREQPPIAALLRTRVLWVVPMANPDGAAMDTRKNGHGVDLNRNFATGWRARADATAATYPGPSAFSEPESQALRDFLRARSRLGAFVDVHRTARMLFVPQGADAAERRILDDAVRELDVAMGRYAVTGKPVPSSLPGLAISWVWTELGVMAFALELPRDQAAEPPSPDVDQDARWRLLRHLLQHCGDYAHRPGKANAARQPAPPPEPTTTAPPRRTGG